MLSRKNLIVHITHTDIKKDSRIIKEIRGLNNLNNFFVMGIGIKSKKEKNKERNNDINLKNITLLVSKIKLKVPRSFLYCLNFVEANIRFTINLLYLRPKIIHVHDTFLLISAVINKIIYKSNLIYDAHELESNKNGQTKILSFATLLIEKLSWRKIDLLISVSDSIINWYCKNIGYKKNLLILNSPELKNFDKKLKIKNLRKYFKIPKKNIIFIYCGLLTKGRFIKEILEIFSEIKVNANLIFLGEGELYNLVSKYTSIYPNIHQHPFVEHDKVVSFIKESDIGLCLIENISLSDYYCLPNKLFEYLFSGINLLASDFPEIKELSKEYKSIYICEPKKKLIKKKILYLIKNKAKKTNYHLNNISWDSQVKKLRAAYKKFLIIK